MDPTSQPADVQAIIARMRAAAETPEASPVDRIAEFVRQVRRSKGAHKAIAGAVTAELAWLRGKYATSTIAPRLSRYRHALRAVDTPATRHALRLLVLDETEITAIKQAARQRVAHNKRHQVPVPDPRGMVSKARHLAAHPARVLTGRWAGKLRWQDLATGLALLTGRRPVELLLTGEFRRCPTKPADQALSETPKPHMLEFRGQAKTRGAEGTRSDWYPIPSLAPAGEVLAAMRRLRAAIPDTIKALKNTPEGRAAVESHLASALRKSVQAAFGHQWTTYDLRAVYALICFHAYAPAGMDRGEFTADILGHKCLVEEGDSAKVKRQAAQADARTAEFYLRFYVPDGIVQHRFKL